MGREEEQEQHSPSVFLTLTLSFVFVDENMPIIGVAVNGFWGRELVEWAGPQSALGLVIGCQPLDLLFQGGDSLQEPPHVLLCPQLCLSLGLLHLALVPALQLCRHRLEKPLSHLAKGEEG